ncbi:MAG: hypothetical protein IIC59_13390 [Proteobacteria bacterium]|nr:hypothetical protein [Pseudomonadota bacterium]MCH8176163.1 hypothetical protein [Pseudomonadota bacterium]
MKKTLCMALLGFVAATASWTQSEGQARIPGWNRVAPPGGHQNDLQLVRPTGGPVIPIFEGWFPNPDGSYQLCFGYFNTNTVETFDIPIGPNNFLEPAEFNGLQPTHFMPQPDGGRRHYCVMSVTVPEDWGDRDVVWTLIDERTEQVFSSPGRLVYSTYRHDEPLQFSRKNSPPKLRLTAEGPLAVGRVGFGRGMVADTIEAEVGMPVALSARVRRDNPYREEDDRAIRVRWFKYQGPGDVTFTPNWSSWKEKTLGWIAASSWADSEFAYGQSSTEAVFTQPGEYIVQVQAYNDSGRSNYETNDFEFWCCWTNAFVRINVE